MTNFYKKALIAGAGAALLAGASTLGVSAAPLSVNANSLTNAVPSATTDVQWNGRRGYRGRRAAIGVGALGLGIVAGAAIANSNRGYYDQPYGYGPQAYGYAEEPNGYYEGPTGYYARERPQDNRCTNYGDANINDWQPC